MRIVTGLRTSAEVCAALAADGARAVAGGTAVTLLLRQQLLRPDSLVSLACVPTLHVLREEDGGLRIGACTTLRRLELVRISLLAKAAACVANVRLRNVATLGGSLCEADPDSDVPTALLALGATVRIAGVGSCRDVPLDAFWRGPFEPDLHAGEIVESVWVPYSDTAGSYRRLTNGPAAERPLVCVAVCGNATSARAAVSGGAALPYRVDGAPATLAEVAAQACSALDDARAPAWYRRHLVAESVRRALVDCGLLSCGAG